MSSSYSTGARIALDFSGKVLTPENVATTISAIKNECGADVSLSTHFIDTEGQSWENVVAADGFFRGVNCISSLKEFISLIKKDLVLSGTDIAKYILTQRTCTHLELEKLTYLCYADYLCKTGTPLFKDKIYAYRYGPVVDSVYGKYTPYKHSKIRDVEAEKEDTTEHTLSEIEMPIKSRIMFSTNGDKKLCSIDDTLKRYARFSAGELVDITHTKGSPWERTQQSNLITDTMIKKYHCVEVVAD
jgi:uncharacterized phage-associated protein